MINVIQSAPYAVALLCVTAIYLIFVGRLFRNASRRDRGYVPRMEHWQRVLREAARERSNRTQSAAAE